MLQNTRQTLALFLLVLFTPLVVSLFWSAGDVLPNENRTAAEPPELPGSLADVRALPGALEAYFSDHFGLREEMIRGWRKLHRNLDGNQSYRVLLGSDSWLFLTDGGVVEQNAGRRFNSASVGALLATIADLDVRTAARGIPFAAMIAPNKHAIYDEMLPAFARNTGIRTEFDALVESARTAGLLLIDPRYALREAAASRPVYWRGGTHWTPYGAALAFDAVVSAWGREDARLDVATRFTGTVSEIKDEDLVRFAGLSGRLSEDVPQIDLFSDRPERAQTIRDLDDRRQLPSYEMLIAGGGPTVLVIGDSFTYDIFRPFWNRFAGRIFWTHHNNGTFDREVIDRVDPDYVLFATAEREIGYWQNPDP